MTPLLSLIRPLNKPANARVDIRAGSAGEATAYSLNGGGWDRLIQTRPRITQTLMSPDLDGKWQLPTCEMTLSLQTLHQFRPWQDLYWTGAAIAVWSVQDLAWDRRVTEFTGIIESAKLDLETLNLALSCTADRTRIDRPLLTAEFTGGGGAAGDPGMRGTKKPAGFGYCENIEWVLFDATYNIGMLDGYANLSSVQLCMEGLNDLGASVGDFASYAALKAAIIAKTIPPGRWGTCIAEGMVGLGAPPAGKITFTATFGSTLPGAIIRRWLTTHAQVSGGDIDTGAFDSIDASIGYEQRCHFREQQQVSDLIEQMCRPLNCTPLILVNGLISITRNGPSAPVATLNRRGGSPRATDWKVTDPIDPIYQVAYRAARPGTVMDLGEVNFVDDIIDRGLYSNTETYRAGNLVWLGNGSSWLYTNATPTTGNAPPSTGTSNAYWTRLTPPQTAADFTYSTGQTIDSLRPQEAGANVTETRYSTGFYGEGALARQNAATWGAQVSGRPVELTDGRVSAGISSNGALQGGLQGFDGALVQMAELFQAIAGTNIAINPEFYGNSAAGWALYNNAGGTKVSFGLVADSSAPNSSGFFGRISYDGTGAPDSGTVTPGFGGAVQQIGDGGGQSRPGFYARNTKLLFKIIARIPVGRTLYYAGNAIGNEATLNYLTNMAGTGDWQRYVIQVVIGKTGTFSTTGFLYVNGGANIAFNWDIAKFDIIDSTAAQRVFMGRGLADEGGVARYAADLVTLIGYSAGFTGEGALARQNTAAYASQISGLPISLLPANLYSGNYIVATYAVYSDGTVMGTLKPAEAGANVTGTHYSIGFTGEGALARLNAVDWNTPGQILNKPTMSTGGRQSITYTSLPSNFIERVLDPGESVALSASVNLNSTGGSSLFRVEIAIAGGSYSTTVNSPSGTFAHGVGEPFTDSFDDSWTNGTGIRQAFRFRAGASSTTGLTTPNQQGQCFLRVG